MLLYDVLLTLAFPKLLWDQWKKGRVRPTWTERFGKKIPDPRGQKVIWIHAVSVGEIKSAQPLFLRLKKAYPASFFLVTTTTATGQDEAKRSLAEANAIAFLPLDFSWVMRKWARTLKPKLFILIETDFWPSLLSALKAQGTRIILASGKLSARSAERFRRFSFFSKKLFSYFDLLCVQNEEHAARFAPFAAPLHITGNLKLDLQSQSVDLALWKHLLEPHRHPIAITCTHAPEEEQLLLALKPLWPILQIFLAPRHPERFHEVEHLLRTLQIPHIRWSQITPQTKGETVILIDAMGQLPLCYSLSLLALVAGSFTDKVGGHNVLEPCLYDCPSLFGPHTHSQTEFANRVLEAGAGLRLSLSALPKTLENLLSTPAQILSMKTAARALIQSSRGAAEQTFSLIQKKEFGNKELKVL